MNRRQLFFSTAKAALATAFGAPLIRQAQAQSATATVFPDSRVLPTPTPPFQGFIQPNFVDGKPGWPPTIMPPEGAPNVLLHPDRRCGLRLELRIWRRRAHSGPGQARESGTALH